MRKIYPYNPKLKELARQLRNDSTLSEILLWNELKGKQVEGYDFQRQKPILNYILDFFCHELELAIEIDGEAFERAFDRVVGRVSDRGEVSAFVGDDHALEDIVDLIGFEVEP